MRGQGACPGLFPAVLAAVLLVAAAAPAAGGVPAARAADEKPAPRDAAGRNPDYDAPTPRWREGPVRYLLSKDEDDAFRALATDEERAGFIQRFWASRDPIAETPGNEYRSTFFARVAEANRLFTESTQQGWKTDRGKIYILLGPPDDIEQNRFPRGRTPEYVIWRYRDPPTVTGAGAHSTIRFVKDQTGEFHLSNSLILEGFETPLSVGFDIQAMQMKSLPEQKNVLDTIVSARERFESGPFRTHRDFFRSGDGHTFTILTLGVRTGLLADPPDRGAGGSAAPAGGGYRVLARLVGEAPEQPSYDYAGENGLRGGEGGPLLDAAGYALFQGGLPVRPGVYTAYYGVIGRDSDLVASFKESLEIPDLREPRFTLSRITLASRLEHLEGSPTTYSAPFVLGGLRVVPRPDDVFRNGEDFSFYYQIYGPQTDPIDGRPDLDLEYRFFVARDDGDRGLSFVPLGMPIRLTRQRSHVQGYSLPLKDWRPATYRLRVEVKDNLGDERAIQEVSFRVQ